MLEHTSRLIQTIAADQDCLEERACNIRSISKNLPAVAFSGMFGENRRTVSQYIREAYVHTERKGHPRIA